LPFRLVLLVLGVHATDWSELIFSISGVDLIPFSSSLCWFLYYPLLPPNDPVASSFFSLSKIISGDFFWPLLDLLSVQV
jgi:hypothetical protein